MPLPKKSSHFYQPVNHTTQKKEWKGRFFTAASFVSQWGAQL